MALEGMACGRPIQLVIPTRERNEQGGTCCSLVPKKKQVPRFARNDKVF
jgi:hypothetical protein